MKTKLLSIALACIAFAATSAQAQTDNDYIESNSRPLAKGKGVRAREGKPLTADKMYRPQKFTDFAFEGILLDIDQQSKIDAINKEFKQKREACRKSCSEGRQQCTDSTKCCKSGIEIDKTANRGSQMKRDYVNAVKGVLTPEQYVTFLENIVFMPRQQAASGFGNRGGSRQNKEFRGGHHGMRKADRQQSADKQAKRSDKK